VAIATLKAKFPCLDTPGPVDPLLQSADEILRLDSLLGKVLTSLPMEELIEMHNLHLQVKRQIEPWFEECQIPKPWIGTPVSIKHCSAPQSTNAYSAPETLRDVDQT
jgi:hypothetical protein